MDESIPDRYVWLIWSSLFLLPWLVLYVLLPAHRRVMRWASFLTAPFGLTEPLFVPEYWSPPSLFDLALRTGFDIESLIFSFGIGGVGVVLYNAVTGRATEPLPPAARQSVRHRYHAAALLTPAILFPALYALPWNPIYAAIVAMAGGAVAALLCRPDLAGKTLVGAVLFVLYYTLFLGALEWSAPGYIARVWNLDALSGVLIFGIPLEELLFALAFGAFWSGVYEHLSWRRASANQSKSESSLMGGSGRGDSSRSSSSNATASISRHRLS